LARSPEYPQRIRVASVFEFFVWLSDCSLLVCLEANFLIFLLLTSSFIVLSPLLLARSPEYPQRIRVASVFEPFICCDDWHNTHWWQENFFLWASNWDSSDLSNSCDLSSSLIWTLLHSCNWSMSSFLLASVCVILINWTPFQKTKRVSQIWNS